MCVRVCAVPTSTYISGTSKAKLEYSYVYKCATWAERGALVLNTKYPDISVGKEGENVLL